ncbi:MAG: hypothetical protein MZU84_07175 [Sphingobacterium sp.]|nr:hypothetical protein [Sphingobacterium sp.]
MTDTDEPDTLVRDIAPSRMCSGRDRRTSRCRAVVAHASSALAVIKAGSMLFYQWRRLLPDTAW